MPSGLGTDKGVVAAKKGSVTGASYPMEFEARKKMEMSASVRLRAPIGTHALLTLPPLARRDLRKVDQLVVTQHSRVESVRQAVGPIIYNAMSVVRESII